MSANTRLKVGIALLILGLIMPFGTVLVAATNWPGGLKAVVSGILVFGLEIMAIPAAAIMGKENYNRIVGRVKTALKRLKPPGDVGRTRYRIGLVLLVLNLLIGWVISYLSLEYDVRVGVNLTLDLVFVATLFVLGGDFWDKVRALFIHDARVVEDPPAKPASAVRRA